MRAVQSSQKRNRTHRVVESRGIASSVVFGSQFNGGFDSGKGYPPPPSSQGASLQQLFALTNPTSRARAPNIILCLLLFFCVIVL